MYTIYMINDTAASPIIPNITELIISCFVSLVSRTGLIKCVVSAVTLELPVITRKQQTSNITLNWDNNTVNTKLKDYNECKR